MAAQSYNSYVELQAPDVIHGQKDLSENSPTIINLYLYSNLQASHFFSSLLISGKDFCSCAGIEQFRKGHNNWPKKDSKTIFNLFSAK